MSTAAETLAPTVRLTVSQRLRRVLAISLPIVAAMTSQNILNLIDTAMVGRLGAEAVASTGIGGIANWFISSALLGMGAGVQTLAARRVGEGKPAGGIDALHSALVLAFVVAMPMSLLAALFAEPIMGLLADDPVVVKNATPYLQVRLCAVTFATLNFSFRGYWNGIGKSTVYMRTLWIMHGSNVVLNYLLIFGKFGFPEMGVTGAAVASAASVVIGSVIYIYMAMQTVREHGFLKRRPKGTDLRALIKLSVPAGAQQLFMSAGFLAFFFIVGKIGTAELAAANIVLNLVLVGMLPGLGLGLGAASLVGQALGAKKPEEAKRWGWDSVAIALAVMGSFGAMFAAVPEFWLALFVDSPETIAVGAAPLRLMGLAQFVDAAGVVLMHSLIGAGAVSKVFLWSVVTQWGLFVPLAWFWGVEWGGGLFAVYAAMLLYRASFAVAMVVMFQRGRWIHLKV